ncbi:MAG: integrase arm-type DNA-binding domain-containing protein [Pseudomonadota bacterium]|nr:integrase arm-type DNA-binding domain-containing protein [Pseudomonadota bacterium]
MRATNRLTALQVKTASPGKYNDGNGLWLKKRSDGGGQWILRFTLFGRRHEMGLGSALDVSLREARELASKWREVVRQGKDPIKERERLKREASKADTELAVIAQSAFEARQAELKDDGKAGRWFSPIELHVLPKLGKVPVEEIDQQDIKAALAPIWHTKGETAKKAMERLGIILRHAAAMGLEVDLMATAKAKELLGRSRQETKHIPALAWQQMPAFYSTLDGGTRAELALRLLILTAVRSKSLRYARWADISDDLWVIPAEYMKGKLGTTEPFHVPLCAEAVSVLKELKPFERDGWVFPGRDGGVMSDMTMTKYLKDEGYDFRPHGFRSSFRTWCAEATDVPREVAEAAIAHKTGSKVERSYRRTDFFERRRVLMERWGNFLTGGQGAVVQMAASHA